MEDVEIIILLADIHANPDALKAVRDDVGRRYGRYRLNFWFIGDLFGRGPDPAETWDLLMALKPEASIAGNHDFAINGRNSNVNIYAHDAHKPPIWTGKFNNDDWQVLLEHQDQLKGHSVMVWDPKNGEYEEMDVISYLNCLPIIHHVRPGIYLVHGGWEKEFGPPVMSTPLNTWWDYWVWGYVKESYHVQQTIIGLQWIHTHRPESPDFYDSSKSTRPPTVIIVGHWHYRRLYAEGVWRVNGRPHKKLKIDHWYQLWPTPENPVLISPGSVGFSSEIDNRDACYAALLLKNGEPRAVQYHGVPYNQQPVIERMKARSYPYAIIRRLLLGKDIQNPNGYQAHASSSSSQYSPTEEEYSNV